jgi:predicted RNA-binding Zn ribbon-like protein
MTDSRIPAIFIADSTGLDFLNSIATPVDTPVEWLGSGADLLAWLQEAELVSDEVIAEFQSRASNRALDAVAAEARDLREWFRDFVKKQKGKPLSAAALKRLAPLNDLLETDEIYRQIVAHRHSELPDDGSELQILTKRRWAGPRSLLLPIAEAMAELVCNEDFTQVKACEGASCTLMFVDKTRGKARRWCSMAVCGNRAKQQAHRARLEAES